MKLKCRGLVRIGSALLDLLRFEQVTRVLREKNKLCHACVREIFSDSWSICESRTHMTSISGDYDIFW